MRKFLVQADGSQEEVNADSPQQLAELYQGMGIDDFKILRDLGPVQQQVINNDTHTVDYRMIKKTDLPYKFKLVYDDYLYL